MNIKTVLLIVSILLLPLSMEGQARTIKSEMERLHKARNINFVYDASIPTDKPYNGPVLTNMSTDKALATLFKGSGISYRRNGSYVLLSLNSKNTTKTPDGQNTKTPKKTKSSVKTTRYTISGYVRNANGESLINATVYDVDSHQGTTTNAYGYYSLTLSTGKHHVRYGYIGYDNQIQDVKLNSNLNINVELHENAQLDEVVVNGDLNSPLLTTQTGKHSFSKDDIMSAFSLASSPDIIKTLQRSSGVTTGVELASGLYVHGGDADENLILLDGSPLYSINHTLGLFSAFNVDMVKNIDFYKSGFPARYSSRLSSVVDVRTADGDMQHLHGSYRIGLLDGSFHLEGPLRKDKTSFNIGLRRSWIDLLTRPFCAIRNSKFKDHKINLYYFFHDLNAKVTNIFNDRSRISLSLYSGEDKLRSKDEMRDDYGSGIRKDITEEDFSWGNFNAALDWQYRLSPKMFANFTVFYTYNRSRVRDYSDEGETENNVETYTNRNTNTYHSTINDAGYRAAFDYRPSPHHHIRFGMDYTWHSFRPQNRHDVTLIGETDHIDSTLSASRNNHYANEWDIYAEDEMSINDNWSLNAGINASLFHITGKTFSNADPRFAIKYQVNPRLSLKASATVMSQYVHKIANTFLELPTDYWVPTTSRLHPMKSIQYAMGVYYQPDSHWLISLEGYLKRTHHILQYSSWTGLVPPAENWDRFVMDGRGKFYGIEADALYKTSRLTLQGAYTLSWNKRKYDDFYPRWFYDKFDNRHKINLSAQWNISSKVSMFAVWTFHTGNHITIPTQYVFMPNVPDGKPVFNDLETQRYASQSDGITSNWINNYYYEGASSNFIYEKPNNLTLPAYHRLDVGFDFKHKTRHGHEIIWNLSVYNAYCHLNSMYVDVDFNNFGRLRFRNHSYFPILPSVSYTYKF